MRATVIAHAVASLIVVAHPQAPAFAQDTATAVSAATRNTPAQSPAVGSDTIRFGGRIIEAGDTVNGPVLTAAGDLRVRGVIRGTAVAIAGDIIVEDGGTITGDAIAVLGSVVTQRGTVAGAARTFSRSFGWLDEVEQTPPPRRGTSDAMSLSLGWLVVMLLVGIGVLVFAGAYLDGVTDVLEQSFGRSFLVGIAGELGVIPVLVLVVAALAVTVVGILLIPFAIVAYVLAVMGFLTLGFLSVARLAGGSIGGTRGEVRGRALRALVLGIVMFIGAWVLAAAFQWSPAISGILRMIALAVTWVAATAGFGAAILSRGGTHRDAAKKAQVDESAAWQTPTPITGVAAARKPVRT
jgi:hypothetical protein